MKPRPGGEVNSERAVQIGGFRITRSAKGGRRTGIAASKSPGKGFMCFIAGGKGDPGDECIGLEQLSGRAFNSQSTVHFERGFANQAAKHAVKTELRHRGFTGQRVEIKRVIEAACDRLYRPKDRPLVEISGTDSHATNLSMSRQTRLIRIADFEGLVLLQYYSSTIPVRPWYFAGGLATVVG